MSARFSVLALQQTEGLRIQTDNHGEFVPVVEVERLREAAQVVVDAFETGPACASIDQISAWTDLRSAFLGERA